MTQYSKNREGTTENKSLVKGKVLLLLLVLGRVGGAPGSHVPQRRS